MPNVFLEPIPQVDAAGKPTGQVSDSAADVTAFLLSVPADWQPTDAPAGPGLTVDEERALEDLTTVWLSASFPKRLAATYAKEGIPDRLAATVKVDERGLLQQNMTPGNRTQQQLDYVAKRSLSRYGCFGCHDIPGYEGAKPIGTPLANWGRKDVSQLAFENIGVFLETHGLEADGSDAHHGEHGGGHGLDPLDYDPDTGFFLQSLNSHQRMGFLWQKLRMPRSFDFAATKTKRYDERLRMPQFPFSKEQREEVMTFVLGLTSEPPAQQYIFNPGPREKAIVEGRHVLDKYNCKRLPRTRHGAVAVCVQHGHVRSAARCDGLPVRESEGDAGRDRRLAHAGPPRHAPRGHSRHARHVTKRRANRTGSTLTECRSSRTTPSRHRTTSSRYTSHRWSKARCDWWACRICSSPRSPMANMGRRTAKHFRHTAVISQNTCSRTRSRTNTRRILLRRARRRGAGCRRRCITKVARYRPIGCTTS